MFDNADTIAVGVADPPISGVNQVAKEPKGKPRGRPATGRKPTVTVFARVPPELGKAFDDYLDGLRPRPSATSVVITALEDFLRSKGLWPTSADADA